MEQIKISEIFDLTKKEFEERQSMYRNPIYVPVMMVVELDDQGRISRYSHPGMSGILGKQLVDDTKWPFPKDAWVYHRTLKQVGRFIEVDQLDPSSATVEFIEDDGYKDEKRISLSLLTLEVPPEKHIVYTAENGGVYTKERILVEIQQWVSKQEKLAHVPDNELPILLEIIYRVVIGMLSWQVPSTILDEFEADYIAEILKMHGKAVLIAKGRAARLDFKNDEDKMNIEESAGYYLSEYKENALKVFDEKMMKKELSHASDSYIFSSRVRELILAYLNVR